MTKSLHKISMVDNEPEPDEVGRTSEGASHLRRYPAYKDSGVPWLGEIPAHWEIGPGLSAFREKKVKNTGMVENTVLSLSYGKIVVKPPEKLHGLVPASFETYQIVEPTDIIIRPTDLQNDWTSLRVGLARNRGIITSAYMCLRTIAPAIPDYGYLLLHAYDLMKIFYGMGSGLRQNLDFSDLKRMPVLLPPPDEQRAIARFLEAIDRLTRRYINAQRRLIALLTEQKQALIQQAVTRGLNPDAPLKDSGVEWLGEIPAHWEVVRSRRLFSIRKEFARPDDIQLSATQAYGVIPQAEFEEKVGRRVVKIFMHLEKRRHVEKDDFVISMRSFQGGLERAWTSGAIRSSYVVLKPELSIDVDFFTYLFKSHDYIRALQATADFIRDGQDLTYENFCCVDLPLMPIDEQTAIADFISRATAGIDRGISRFSRQIDLVREYRTRLIADVVTGKLDVRGVALPEVPGEEADFDAGEDLSEDPDGDPTEDDVKMIRWGALQKVHPTWRGRTACQ